MMDIVKRIWDGIKFGETVLVEHPATTPTAIGLCRLVKWAKKKGYDIIIDDILDALYLYKMQMKLSGCGDDILDDVKVIKEGGRLEVGKVVKRLSIKEPVIQEREYRRIFDPLLKGQVINPVVGFEKLLLLANSKQDILTLVNGVLSFVGDERKISFYFINTDVLEDMTPRILPLLEEVATTVIRVTKEGRDFTLAVIKSVNNEIEGMRIKV
ncbi:hypothetical protein E3E31_09580 [Thermococcus sp. M39]|uniref:DUF257 family protein n=1 Tax=unclassified Thermococcus TaxID=2627626 RepID=UPI00143C1762|nr:MULTISPECIES: DUF257 family protein [unclassified Thermococcus]NJE08768.1 hypothetical protein [Thermococcus sp. M39]NJE12930.1 hypothetical protein [Thermococcus sp. LS2]